jgi:hypothetical protein
MLKPGIEAHEMDAEVAAFEASILFYADAFHKYGPGTGLSVPVEQTSLPSSGALTPALSSECGSSATSSGPPSRQPASMDSIDSTDPIRRPSFVSRLSEMLIATALELEEKGSCGFFEEDARYQKSKNSKLQAWQLEAATTNRSVKILPGVRRMLSSIPKTRYAVATSGAKLYGEHGNHIDSSWSFQLRLQLMDAWHESESILRKSQSLPMTSASKPESLPPIHSCWRLAVLGSPLPTALFSRTRPAVSAQVSLQEPPSSPCAPAMSVPRSNIAVHTSLYKTCDRFNARSLGKVRRRGCDLRFWMTCSSRMGKRCIFLILSYLLSSRQKRISFSTER